MTNSKLKEFCNSCERTTYHTLLYSTGKVEYTNEEDALWDKTVENDLIQCDGCKFIGLRVSTIYINDKDDDGNPVEISHTYPDAEPEEGYYYLFLEEEELRFIPKKITRVYEEVTEAIDNEANLLAGMGLRTIVEAVCIDRKVKGRNLKEKIDQLFTDGYISRNDLTILHKLREMGNTSAHQIKSPPLSTLDLALEIINHLLRSVYVIPKRGKKIKF